MEIMHYAKGGTFNDEAKEESTSQRSETVEARRARRMLALKKAAGLWGDRADIPADGLEYQRKLRAEWR